MEEADLPWTEVEEAQAAAAIRRMVRMRMLRRLAPWVIGVALLALAVVTLGPRVAAWVTRISTPPPAGGPWPPVAPKPVIPATIAGVPRRVAMIGGGVIVTLLAVPGDRVIRAVVLLLVAVGALVIWHFLQPMLGAVQAAQAAATPYFGGL